MKLLSCISTLALTLLTGCATMSPPSVDKVASMPVVSYPETSTPGNFIYKLPAGKPIATRVAIQGTALATGARQELVVTLPRDLYIHKNWVSEDLKTWQRADDLLTITLDLKLPSDEHPKPGEITLQVNRKETK